MGLIHNFGINLGTTTSTSTTTSTTITTVPKATTTTTTTTTSTTVPADTVGPSVRGVSANPGTIFTSGTAPDVSGITASVTDPSGVAGVRVYYRSGKAAFSLWGPMKTGGAGTYTSGFGPFGTLGSYEYRIFAVDTIGNTNCSSGDPSGCPGGFVTVILP